MKKNIIIAVISLILILIVFAGGFLSGFNYYELKNYVSGVFRTDKDSGIADTMPLSQILEKSPDSGMGIIEAVINNVMANAIEPKTRQELIEAAILGILSSLGDRYADYFSSEDYAKILESYSGTMSGIGIVVTMDEEGRVIVVSTIDNTPAFEAGIKEADIIIRVDGVDLKDMALDNVVALIKGEEGTEVQITVFRPSENVNIDYNITRKRFYVPNFYINVVEENILYIRYADFQEDGAKKLDEKIKSLKADGKIDPKGIVLDLRNNLGGTLDDAVELCNLFIEEGVIVSVRGRSNNKDKFEEFKATRGVYTDIPIVVLVNGYSASAAELAAGALRDLGRALLVGEQTFGKGTVQILNKLPDGSGIKYTTARYYLPSGATIDGVGVEPDINVVLSPDSADDLQLERAIEEVKKMASI